MTIRNISLIVVLLLAPVGVWYWMNYCGSKELDIDYSTSQPAQVYHDVIGGKLPSSMDNVKIAGHHGYDGKARVWMKLHGPQSAMDALTSKAELLYTNKITYPMPDASLGIGKVYYADALAAGWNEVPEIRDPKAYLLNTSSDSGRWTGTIVICTKTHTAYVSANLQ